MELRLAGTILLIAVSILFQGCDRPEPVTFEKITNARIHKITTSELIIKGEAQFYNPNKIKGQIRDINIIVDIDGRRAATIVEGNISEFGKESTFFIPFKVSMPLSTLGQNLLGSMLKSVLGEKIKMKYQGSVKVKVYGFRHEIPIDYEQEIVN